MQIDGWVRDVMNVDPLAEKYRAFNWNVLEIDGHDMDKILEAFERARAKNDLPTLIIAHTVKGKGVSFMENEAGWHGVAPNREQFEKAMVDLATPSVPRARVEALLARAAEYGAQVSTQNKRHPAGLPPRLLVECRLDDESGYGRDADGIRARPRESRRR